MTTHEVLRTARAFASKGYSPSACCIGDWPDAASAFRRANPWWRPIRWMPLQTKGMLVRALERAMRLAA